MHYLINIALAMGVLISIGNLVLFILFGGGWT
jgi:hypothetical protein